MRYQDADLPEVIRSTYTALTRAGAPTELCHIAMPKPAVPINKSILPDLLICLEDGKKFKTLKRHLSTDYGLTPQLYRERWGLPPDYPMVTPNHSKRRSNHAELTGPGIKAVKSVGTAPPKIQIVSGGRQWVETVGEESRLTETGLGKPIEKTLTFS